MCGLVISVDVGSRSARAAVVNPESGNILGKGEHEIPVYSPYSGWFEQSSREIWHAVCTAIPEALREAHISKDQVKGIAFDATCSMVIHSPSSTSSSSTNGLRGIPDRDIIMWMDHRAEKQATEINRGGHPVLDTLGRCVSPEHEIPKLLWLKQNEPDLFYRAEEFFDLADWLVFKATGSQCRQRSVNTLSCKWTWTVDGFHDDFFQEIGLEEMPKEHYKRLLGTDYPRDENQPDILPVAPLGSKMGTLSVSSAQELGLFPNFENISVASGIIDAYAGALGILGSDTPPSSPLIDGTGRMAMVAGTSACMLTVTSERVVVPGVWGPFRGGVNQNKDRSNVSENEYGPDALGVLLPGKWALEAGQSTAGAALDRLIKNHPVYPELKSQATQESRSIYDILNQWVKELSNHDSSTTITHESNDFNSSSSSSSSSSSTVKVSSEGFLSQNIHVLSDVHGNRSPLADPSIRGAVVGLSLDESRENMVSYYMACIQSLAYGTKLILEHMQRYGDVVIHDLNLTGGLVANRVYVQQLANITSCRVIVPREKDSVLVGTAVLAAVASGGYDGMEDAMVHMSGVEDVVEPEAKESRWHRFRYEVFCKMIEDQKEYQKTMKNFNM